MGFSNFTLRDVVRQFCLVTSEVPDLFADARDVEPSPLMRSILGEYTPLALAINTEKARSELLIAPILVEVRSHLSHRISLFSGVEFVADAAQGLTGYCDFLLARSAEQQFLTSPLLMVVEAKNENLKSGLGQCAATMVGARLFNQREGGPVDRLFGAVTTGTLWRFLRLVGDRLELDQREYHIDRIGKVLGILIDIMRTGGPTELEAAEPMPLGRAS